MKIIRKRLIIVFTIFSLLVTSGFYFMMTNYIEERFVSQQDESMETQLLALSVALEQKIATEEHSDHLALVHGFSAIKSQHILDKDERFTLFNPQGDVLYDSEENSELMENHSDREEVAKVIKGADIARTQRKSDTSDQSEYYIAVPLRDESNRLVAIMRLSKNLSSLYDLTTYSLIGSMVIIIVFLLIIFFLVRHWLLKVEAGLLAIEDVTNELTAQNYEARYQTDSYEEINHVGRQVNELGASIGQRVQESRINEERIQELINHLVIGVMLLDENRQIVMTNPAMNEILGMNLYGQIDRDYNEVIRSSDIVSLTEKAYRKKESINREITIYYPDEKILDVNIVPIPAKDHNELNMIVLLYDITEIRRLEKIRTDFATNASHELRTPITALKGFSETLLGGAMHDEEVLTEFLEIIYKEATRLETIVQDIMQLSRLEQKASQVNAEPVRVSAVAEEVFQILQQKAEIKQIDCQLKETNPIYVLAARDQLKQIILNLVANAITYTPEKGQVTVKINEHAGEVCLIVQDNGIGIPAEDLQRIFERFYRVDQARSRNAGGTGLGLSIVRLLVDSMNGRIEIDTELGRGTIFYIYLPAA